MTKTLEELMAEYSEVMTGTSAFPTEPSNDGCKVAIHIEALVQGSTPEATEKLRPDLDAFVLKL